MELFGEIEQATWHSPAAPVGPSSQQTLPLMLLTSLFELPIHQFVLSLPATPHLGSINSSFYCVATQNSMHFAVDRCADIGAQFVRTFV